MKKALAAAISGILLVPGVLLADDAVPTAPTTTEPSPPTTPAAVPGQQQEQPPQPQPVQPIDRPKAPDPKPEPIKQAKSEAKKPTKVHDAASTSVTIKNFAFAPPTINIHAGDTVTWTNQDSAPHTATGNGGSFNTGILKKGQSGSHTFAKPGRFAYICAVHPSMKGTVVVAGATGGSGGGGGTSSSSGSGASTAGSAGAGGSTQAAATGAKSAASGGSTLPNTGLELGVVALLGALFTAGGTFLRRFASR